MLREDNWLRILYAFPGYISDRLIDVMAEQDQILPYIDIPLQHADPEILKAMRRPANMDWVYRTVEKLRDGCRIWPCGRHSLSVILERPKLPEVSGFCEGDPV